MKAPDIPTEELAAMEELAVDLARLAGAEMKNSLGKSLSVSYKSGDDAKAIHRDPVSEVDHRCEVMVRARIEDRFPTHGILGEELDAKPGDDDDLLWAVDPIDGTTNFVNGFPLFAACIGLIHKRRPIVGATWVSTSHRLRNGVYHAVAGGPLCFDGEIVDPRANPEVRRHLAGEPAWSDDVHGPWDVRKTGSAGIECAFVAAGMLSVVRFERPNIWDVAGGIVLAQAAGLGVMTPGPDGWHDFSVFETTPDRPDFRRWKQPLVMGQDAYVGQMVKRLTGG